MGSWYSFRHKTFEQFDIELSVRGKALGEVAMQNIDNTFVTLCYFIMLDYIFNYWISILVFSKASTLTSNNLAILTKVGKSG